MTHKFSMISAAVALALSASAAHADFDDMVSVRGFGTVGVVHSDVELADVTGSFYQPDGAGYTRDFDLRTLSKLAGQVNLQFTDDLSMTVQAITQYQKDRTFAPQIEWLNLKYSFTPELSARVGRIALPQFMISDSRMVGYANTWVRPPEELYKLAAITSSDGMDVSYAFSQGAFKHSIQAFYGTREQEVPTASFDATSIYGVNYVAEVGAATFRVGYLGMNIDLDVEQLEPMFAGLRQLGGAFSAFGFTTAASQVNSLLEKYKLEDMTTTTLSVGASYDPGQWFVMGELMQYGGDGFLSDARGGYVTAGARFGKLTPYATVASVKGDIKHEPGISTTGLPAPLAMGAMGLNAGLNTTLNQFQGSQQSSSIGLRWDAFNNVAIKGQYDYVNLGANSAGRLSNVQSGFDYGSSYAVYSLTVDFIF